LDSLIVVRALKDIATNALFEQGQTEVQADTVKLFWCR
jgi:hypothetical protein